jgi:hypothetical protein
MAIRSHDSNRSQMKNLLKTLALSISLVGASLSPVMAVHADTPLVGQTVALDNLTMSIVYSLPAFGGGGPGVGGAGGGGFFSPPAGGGGGGGGVSIPPFAPPVGGGSAFVPPGGSGPSSSPQVQQSLFVEDMVSVPDGGATLALFGAALAGLALLRRKRA